MARRDRRERVIAADVAEGPGRFAELCGPAAQFRNPSRRITTAWARAGAHYVGLNALEITWEFCGRPVIDVCLEHWRRRDRAERLRKLAARARGGRR